MAWKNCNAGWQEEASREVQPRFIAAVQDGEDGGDGGDGGDGERRNSSRLHRIGERRKGKGDS